MGKKVYNINAMRPVFIIAHNDGNQKAISKDLVKGKEIDMGYFTDWVRRVDELRGVCYEYVTLKHNQFCKGSDIKPDQVNAARENIYPKWKNVLECGEDKKTVKELHVTESDVEDLIGFCWDFFATTNGTVIGGVKDTVFRRKVEALLGCAIARNAVLTDEERTILDAYYRAIKRIENCDAKIAELQQTNKDWKKLIKKSSSEDLVEFITAQMVAIDNQIKDTEELKANAERDRAEVSAKAKAIEKKIKKAA